MIYYLSKDGKKQTKTKYKTLEGAMKAADKNNLPLVDENMNIVYIPAPLAQEIKDEIKEELNLTEPEETKTAVQELKDVQAKIKSWMDEFENLLVKFGALDAETKKAIPHQIYTITGRTENTFKIVDEDGNTYSVDLKDVVLIRK